jgi:hypothetical protein
MARTSDDTTKALQGDDLRMKLLCTYFAAGIRYNWGQESSFHRVFKVTCGAPYDAVWAADWIQKQIESKGGNVVFTQFNMVGAPQEVSDDFEV